MSETVAQNVQTVTIALDRPRSMALTLGAMRRIKEATGRSITELQQGERGIEVEHVGAYIWAMLVNADREGLSVEDVEEMIRPRDLPEVTAAFAKLFTAASEGAEGNAPRKDRKKAPAPRST